MLYQVKRFRLLSALKVGLLGGFILGELGGFLILPLVAFYSFVQTMLLYDFLPPFDYFINNADKIGPILVYSVGMGIIGAVGGTIAGAIIMGILGFLYNFTTRYSGGLLVELEPRGKLKEKASNNVYARAEARAAPPLPLDDLLDDEDDTDGEDERAILSEAGVRADKSSAIRRHSP